MVGGRLILSLISASALASCTAPSLATPVPTFSAIPASSVAPVVVEDISVDPDTLPAYLVRPESAAPASAPGIVFFHWVEYGSPTSNRTEFLEEAKELALQGVVSILVDGSFPWHEKPEVNRS